MNSLQKSTAILVAASLAAAFAGATARAQCPAPVFASGLRAPTKIIFSQTGNLLVAEQGTAVPNTGRISIINPNTGVVRPLIDGLPSALNLVGGQPAPSGPDGLAMEGRTLYITIGSGNTTLPGPFPGVEVPNPGVSSALFSSVLEVQFSAKVEKRTKGFTLTAAQQVELASGAQVTLKGAQGTSKNGRHHKRYKSDKITIRLVANLPDYVPASTPGFVVSSNPFGLVFAGNQLDITDASLNQLVTVDIQTGQTSILTHFDNVPNTGALGPPTVQPVPDSIRSFGDQLLITFLTGFPFGPGAAQVRIVDATTGANGPFITGLTAAIDVLPLPPESIPNSFLVLEFGGAGLSQPGRILAFVYSPNATPVVFKGQSCLTTPTSMALDKYGEELFVTEISTGNVVRLDVPSGN